MKAIVFENYGSPDVLQLIETEKPVPEDNQVLIKIHAAAANPLDWHRMRAEPFIVRFGDGFRRPSDNRIGVDFAGRVEAVGKQVTEFKPGDDVFGSSTGAFAEYICTTEAAIALKPENISFEGAASIPVVGFTALQGLRAGQIETRKKVLVNGASGGVGSCAVQIAKSYGVEVTGVCSPRNLELVRSIGADHVIDYTQQDFTRTGQTYDLIYDAVGNRTAQDMARALEPGGQCVIAGFTTLGHLFAQSVFMAGLVSMFGSKKIGMMSIADPNQEDLLTLKDLLETEKIAPVIDRCYPLKESAEAIRYLETGRARGKVIINVVENGSR